MSASRRATCRYMFQKFVFVLLGMFLLPAYSQEWPARPIRFVVPFPPGGGSDLVARWFSEHLAARLGQAVVVDNRPGDAGVLAMTLVAKAAPDGYTVVMTSIVPVAFAPATPHKFEYDPATAFSHVAIMAATPLVFVVSNEQPAKSVADIIAAAKAAPNKLNFSSSGNASLSHLMLERFKASTGTQIAHIPYRGSGPALIDIVGNRVDGTIDTMPAVLSRVQAGQIRALAVTGTARMPQLPEIPTLVELGHTDLVATFWFGVAVPAATPSDIVQRLNRELSAISSLPEMSARFDELSLTPLPMSSVETQRFIQEEMKRWRPVVQASGVIFK